MDDRRVNEYSALRATIRERGTVRVVLFWLGLAVWAALVLLLVAAVPVPAAVLVPLVLLLATFEAVNGLHVGVERIGRYLQVFHDDAWEHAAMAYGRRFPVGGPDALFCGVFVLATLVNMLPMVAAGPTPAEWIPLATAHVLFLLRIDRARRRSAGQRALDLDRFQQVAGTSRSNDVTPGSK
jgi:hypothetical protein